ncbi:MAG: M20 family metallopeptidase [Caryophanon sp.]|nr:M20 family metallopeptidase [Caryophanon sp.]
MIQQMIEQQFDEMVAIRRHLHMYPELSFQEVETPKYIAAYHRKLGLDVREQVGGRGVVAILRGSKPGKTVAIRADFDALPIQEENDVPYKSKNDGVMHACGHDGHTAIALGIARALVDMQDTLAGNVVFIHQFAEELAPGGAIAMIEDGCLDGVDVIFGTHLWAPMQLGDIQVRSGAIMAAADAVYIDIQGRGGHGAEPHETVDAVLTGSQFVTAAQSIVSRKVDPLKSAVYSIGHFEAINSFNVIADRVHLKGTVRTFDDDVRDLMEREIETMLKAVCDASGATYTYTYNRGYPPVVNHEAETEFIANCAKQYGNVSVTPPMMIGEDFGYYMQHVPGTFFFTGARKPEADVVYPHHHARFEFDERAMMVAANVLLHATMEYIGRTFE